METWLEVYWDNFYAAGPDNDLSCATGIPESANYFTRKAFDHVNFVTIR